MYPFCMCSIKGGGMSEKKTITLREAALMLAKHNPKVGDYEFFLIELMNAVKNGELTIVKRNDENVH